VCAQKIATSRLECILTNENKEENQKNVMNQRLSVQHLLQFTNYINSKLIPKLCNNRNSVLYKFVSSIVVQSSATILEAFHKQ